MNKRQLGTSNLFVSEIGLGCMSLPDNKSEVQMIIDTAIDEGITFFDTADLYDSGENELRVGEALGSKRKDIVLATKVGNRMNEDGKSWTWDPSKEYVIEAVKNSLQRLGTDYIDLYQLHGGTMEDNADETIEAFERLKQEGVIREYGISSIRPAVIKRFLEESSAVSVMMQYSLLDRRPEEWFPLITENGASVISRGALAKGLLTHTGIDKLSSMNGFALHSPKDLDKLLPMLQNEVHCIHSAAIQFILRSDTIASALVGASSADQLLDSLQAYRNPPAEKQMDTLTDVAEAHIYSDHRL